MTSPPTVIPTSGPNQTDDDVHQHGLPDEQIGRTPPSPPYNAQAEGKLAGWWSLARAASHALGHILTHIIIPSACEGARV